MTFSYRGYLSLKSGYAMASMMDCLALDRVGADFKCGSLVPGRGVHDYFGPADEVVARRLDPTCWDAPGTQILRCIPTDALAPMENARSDQGFMVSNRRDQRKICATVFESPVWPKGWIAASNLYDALVLPSQWLADTARAAGVVAPIHVIPHALVWEGEWARESAARKGYGFSWWDEPVGDEPVRVLSEGTYMLRKNIPAAVEAFWRAFEPGEAVLQLHTHWFRRDHRALLMEELWARRERVRRETGRRALAAVVIDDSNLDWHQLWERYHWVAAAPLRGIYLSMAYAEGVGYPILMAAGLGLPVVCTDCEGHRDTAPWSYLVKSTPTRPGALFPFDPMHDSFRIAHIYDDDPWWKPDPLDAAEKLRMAVRKPSDELLEIQRAVRLRHSLFEVGTKLRGLE